MIISSNIIYIVVISELILILIILSIANRKNILLFYIFNLISSFILFLSLFCTNYSIFLLGNFVKLGIFPFTYIILLFYTNLNISDFIMVNIANLPYLNLIITADLNILIIMLTILYLIYYMYNTNSIILMISIYSVVSTVIMLNINTANILYTYYLASLLSVYLCLIWEFETISMYNLISLPLSLTFYINIQFLISLSIQSYVFYLLSLTFITLYIINYVTHINIISNNILSLLLLNTLLI